MPTLRIAVLFVLVSVTTALAWAAEMTAEGIAALQGVNRMVWLRVPPAGKPPNMDGKLDLQGGEWKNAVCVPGMLALHHDSLLLPLEAMTFITWDKDNFYIGMRTGLLPQQVLRRSVRSHGSGVDHDDAVEIDFDPLKRDQAEPGHFQVIMNALGYRRDLLHSAGAAGTFWRTEGWVYRTDYQPGMDHWDFELAVPVKSFGMSRGNLAGDVWRFLTCRNWRNITLDGKKEWILYSSIGATSGFYYADAYAPLVLDENALAVQVTDLKQLTAASFGLTVTVRNPTNKPVQCVATAKALPASKAPKPGWSTG